MDQQLCKTTVSARALHLSLIKVRAHLTAKVLNLDRAAFESHRETALELILALLSSSGGTARYNRSASWCMRCGRTADLAHGTNEANKTNSDESLYIWWKDAQ
jgi:hypothetical protein